MKSRIARQPLKEARLRIGVRLREIDLDTIVEDRPLTQDGPAIRLFLVDGLRIPMTPAPESTARKKA